MDREPLLPPFPQGARLRYIGTRRVWAEAPNGQRFPYVEPGMIVEVAEARTGRQGTLRPLPGEWVDDDPPLDTTRDGYSVYRVYVPGGKPFGRIIWPADAEEWEEVAGA